MQHPPKIFPKPAGKRNKPAPPGRTQPKVLQTGPGHVGILAVFLTNQCNLACTHCCADTVKKSGRAQHLPWEDFKNAIDLFMDPRHVPYDGRKVLCLEGGETFLAFETILRAARYAKTFAHSPYLYVHTNGTLATPGRVRKLRELDVEILVSLDGDKKGNDVYRRFPGGSRRSVFDAVLKRLRALPKDGLGVNMVLRPDSLDGMVSALNGLSRMGIGFVNLAIDYYHLWTPPELKRLEDFLDDFAEYYVRHTERTGEVPFRCGSIHDGLKRAACLNSGRPWWKECAHVILGADGNFYACESIGMFPWSDVARDYAINHASDGRGIDWEKRRAYMREADLALIKYGRPDAMWQHMCPRLYYTVEKVRGGDPRPMVDMMHTTSRIFYEGILDISVRLRNNPSFQKEHIQAEAVRGS